MINEPYSSVNIGLPDLCQEVVLWLSGRFGRGLINDVCRDKGWPQEDKQLNAYTWESREAGFCIAAREYVKPVRESADQSAEVETQIRMPACLRALSVRDGCRQKDTLSV